MPTIDDIERQTKLFADARAELAERLQALKDEQEAAKRRRIQGLKNAVARLREEHAALLELLSTSQGLFEQPKTRTFHNVRVGWIKSKGKLEIADVEQVISLIRKHFPDQADVLIRVSEAPNKSALAELAAKDLKRLGVGVGEDTEAPFIKAADGDIDRMIDGLLGRELEEVRA